MLCSLLEGLSFLHRFLSSSCSHSLFFSHPVEHILSSCSHTDSFSSTENTGKSQGVLDELLGISLSKASGLELGMAGSDGTGPISSVVVNWLFSFKKL